MLRVTVESRGEEEIAVAMEGEITGHVDFAELLGRKERMVLDMAGVRRLNSQGVHRLVEFLTNLAGGVPVEAERLSPAMVTQLNLVPRMADMLVVRSLFVPLECLKCFHEDETLVEIGSERLVPMVPKIPCPACGKADMEIADMPARYFAFLSRE